MKNSIFPFFGWIQQLRLVSMERIFILSFLIFLALPLIKKQKDIIQEKRRMDIIKLSTAAGVAAIAIRIYRYLWNLN